MNPPVALVTGGAGQLGSDLAKECSRRGILVRTLARSELDVTDRDAVANAIKESSPDVIFNCAAFHQLDRCEENPGLARRVNVGGVVNLRDAAGQARLIHVSTNYVFSGTRPVAEGGYIESDIPTPLQEYGKSKLAGEEEVGDDALVIRTAGLYGNGGAASKGGSFVDRMLAREGTIRMVADQYINPTSTVELARAMIECWMEGVTGVVHLVNQGGCSWFDFTAEILRLSGRANRLEPVNTEPEAVPKRPLNGLLGTTRELSTMKSWQQALDIYLNRA